MDYNTLEPLVDVLEGNIDDLEEALTPLLNAPIADTASKLPLLDKAKLYVMTTYAIESLLFSYLQLNGIKAKEHPIFVELTRLKQYYEKIKVAEAGPMKRNMVLDRNAADRFIKHGLSGNEKFDQERAEKQAKEKTNAYIKFNQVAEQQEQDRLKQERLANRKRKAAATADLIDEDDESSSDGPDLELYSDPKSAPTSAPDTDSTPSKKSKKLSDEDTPSSDKKDSKKRAKFGKEKAKKIIKQSPLENQKNRHSEAKEETIFPRRHKSNVPPKSPGTAFQALLQGPLPRPEGAGANQKNRRRRPRPNT